MARSHTHDERAEELEQKAEAVEEEAQAIEALRNRVRAAGSIAQDVPVLSELFHEARTSSHKRGDGSYVALLDREESGWTCRTVRYLESGASFRDTGADLKVRVSPMRFMATPEFSRRVCETLDRQARAARQNMGQLRDSARTARSMAQRERER